MGQTNPKSSSKLVIIGNVGSPFGVKGWVRIYSYTEPKENILHFKNWLLFNEKKNDYPTSITVIDYKYCQDQLLVLFSGFTDRNKAALITNKQVAVNRSDLPELPIDQYYWTDLLGMDVYNLSGELLGFLDYMMETTANDIMIVKNSNKKTYLIPYKLQEFVIKIDLYNKKIIVNWDL